MHPVFAKRGRLQLYLLSWTPVAGMLVLLLAVPGSLSWIESLAVLVPLCDVYAFVCLSAWYLCRSLPLDRSSVTRLLAYHLSAALVSSVGWVALGSGIAYALGSSAIFPGLAERFARQLPLLFGMGVVLYLLASAFHYVILALEASREAEGRTMEARILAREAELKALKAQVNPHFLFNSLHSISALTSVDPGGAREMCVLLADFLRRTLGLGEKASIPLSDELALARSYLAVEQVRFGAQLVVEESSDEASARCLVPPLLLQPLVENAVVHGVATMVANGWVRIATQQQDGHLLVTIENAFDGDAPTRRRGGLGIANVRKRIEVRYGTGARLDVSRNDGRHRVELRLPAEIEEEPR